MATTLAFALLPALTPAAHAASPAERTPKLELGEQEAVASAGASSKRRRKDAPARWGNLFGPSAAADAAPCLALTPAGEMCC